jgi:Protein of unknown function (DUF2442)
MESSLIRLEPLAKDVEFTSKELVVYLADGRRISAPLAWFPRLQKATLRQRKDFKFIGDGIGIHWPAVDEDISVENLLLPKAVVRRGVRGTKRAR